MAGRLGHWAKRYAGSIWPGGPGPEAEAWVESILGRDEHALWRRMNGPDRRHAIGVARRTEAALGPEATRPVLAAALLHDVGKLASGLRTYGRVVATVAGAATSGRLALAWSRGRGYTRRVGLYLRHAPLGADMLAMAGSDPLTVAWTREHHLPPEEWTIPAGLAGALKAADDD